MVLLLLVDNSFQNPRITKTNGETRYEGQRQNRITSTITDRPGTGSMTDLTRDTATTLSD